MRTGTGAETEMATQPTRQASERALPLQLNKKCGDYNDYNDVDDYDDDDDVATAIATCAVFALSMQWGEGCEGRDGALCHYFLCIHPA
ncbi:GH18886 [Drosophila grimshawi]|uniref:GH18886 n=1 Tax=Drosophila grimshawi TaxID=7222 RepID=B4JGP9_DROGR|nr:GH18886 [Drosophila grimshawi]